MWKNEGIDGKARNGSVSLNEVLFHRSERWTPTSYRNTYVRVLRRRRRVAMGQKRSDVLHAHRIEEGRLQTYLSADSAKALSESAIRFQNMDSGGTLESDENKH